MAGVIKPLMSFGDFHGDIDSITDNRIVNCSVGVSTSNSGLPFGDETFLLCAFSSSTETNYFKCQIAVNMAQGSSLDVKIRRKRSSWSEWKSVSFV